VPHLSLRVSEPTFGALSEYPLMGDCDNGARRPGGDSRRLRETSKRCQNARRLSTKPTWPRSKRSGERRDRSVEPLALVLVDQDLHLFRRFPGAFPYRPWLERAMEDRSSPASASTPKESPQPPQRRLNLRRAYQVLALLSLRVRSSSPVEARWRRRVTTTMVVVAAQPVRLSAFRITSTGSRTTIAM
jgi:hypothetical protein